MKPVWNSFKYCTSLFISGLRQNPLIFKIDQINNYISVWTVTRKKQLPNWSKNASEVWGKFNRNTMYTVASVPCFHAGFGKSDLTRVFWESRDSTNSTRSRITAADMRNYAKEGGKKDRIFSHRHSWYWKYSQFYRRLNISI